MLVRYRLRGHQPTVTDGARVRSESRYRVRGRGVAMVWGVGTNSLMSASIRERDSLGGTNVIVPFSPCAHAHERAILSFAAGATKPRHEIARSAVPVTLGWYNDAPTTYLATDASDAGVVKAFGANYVPQLANAALGPNTSTDEIYVFMNWNQANVIASTPQPAGPGNNNKSYSPLWLVSHVTWATGIRPRVLRSERAILKAAAKGEVTIAKTTVVVNCPVLHAARRHLTLRDPRRRPELKVQ